MWLGAREERRGYSWSYGLVRVFAGVVTTSLSKRRRRRTRRSYRRTKLDYDKGNQ